MATESNLISITVPAGSGGLATSQFCAVQIDTNGTAVLAADDKNCDGILQNKPAEGQAAEVAIFGVSKAKITDTVTVGELLEVAETGGTLVPVDGGTVVAKALEGGATGNIITVLMLKSNAVYV